MRYWAVLILATLSGSLWADQASDLLQVYGYAREANPQLKAAEQTLEMARAQEGQTLSVLLPQVKAFGSYSANEFHQNIKATPLDPRPNLTRDYPGKRAGVSVQQVLFQLPAFLEKLRFSSLTEQRQEEYESAKKDLMALVVERYFDVLAAQDILEVLTSEKTATEKDMRRIQEMFKRQLASITDVYQIEANYDALLAKEITAQSKLDIARESLREVIGTRINAIRPLKSEVRFPGLNGSVEDWVTLAKENSPVLQALIYGIDAAETYVEQQWASHLPTVQLSLNYIYSDVTYDNRALPPYDSKYASVDMSLPIYSGGGIEAKRKEAIARLNIAKETREEKERAIEKQTRTAFLTALASKAQIESDAKAVRSAEKAYDAQEKSYGLGLSTIVDVLKAQKDRLEARLTEINAKYEYIRSYVQLKHSAGILSDEDLEEVNRWIGS